MNMKKVSFMLAFAALLSLTFCAVAAESLPGMTEAQQKILEEGVASSESSFHQQYRLLWSEQKFDEKIKPAVSKAMNAKLEGMSPLSLRYKLSFNVDDVIGEIVKNSLVALQPDYDAFAVELSKRYNPGYVGEVLNVTKNFVVVALATSNSAEDTDLVKRVSADLLSDAGKKVKEKIVESLPEGVKISAPIETQLTVPRRTGWRGFMDSTCTFFDIFSNVADDVENDVFGVLKEYFYKEAPTVMWKGAEGDVRKGFAAVYDEFISAMQRKTDEATESDEADSASEA